jgi:hypothetical protein
MLFSIQCSPISERALLFGRFPGFARLSFRYEQVLDEDEYGVSLVVELYLQEKTEALGEKPAPVPLRSSQTSHGLT